MQGLFRSVRDTTEILQGGKYIVCLTGCKICDNCWIKDIKSPGKLKTCYKSKQCERKFCLFASVKKMAGGSHEFFVSLILSRKQLLKPLSFQEAMAKKRNSPGLNCSTALIILPKLACGQALHWGESREVTWEQHTKGDTSARGGKRKRQLATISPTFSFPPQKAQETTKHENCYTSVPGAKYYNSAQRKDHQKKITKIVVCMDFLVWIVAYSRIYNISWIQREHVASILQSYCILFKILHQQKTHLLFSTVSKSGYADTPIRSGWVSAYPPILGGCFKVAGYILQLSRESLLTG